MHPHIRYNGVTIIKLATDVFPLCKMRTVYTFSKNHNCATNLAMVPYVLFQVYMLSGAMQQPRPTTIIIIIIISMYQDDLAQVCRQMSNF